MSMAAAKVHEISEGHVYHVEKEEWDMKHSWGGGEDWGVNKSDWMTKTDKLNLMVEYWYQGVQAAHRGEELKYEMFLETLDLYREND